MTDKKTELSKQEIYHLCKTYPEKCFWFLTKENFAFAKAFWGEGYVCFRCLKPLTEKKCLKPLDSHHGFTTIAWCGHLQQMVLEEQPLKYLERYLENGGEIKEEK